jgi:hypothetical protein
MHKGIVLLVKPEETSREAILDKVDEFMEQYGDGDVWDWKQIGGRWTNTLAPKYKEFHEWANALLEKQEEVKKGKPTDWISQDTVDQNSSVLQSKWEEIGMKGQNPYCNHYELGEEGGVYDVMPLSECIDAVKELQQDPIAAGREEFSAAEKWLNGERAINDYRMYGYCLKKAGEIFSQDFCFDCNIFNVEADNYSIPTELDGWFAVMVDIHN